MGFGSGLRELKAKQQTVRTFLGYILGLQGQPCALVEAPGFPLTLPASLPDGNPFVTGQNETTSST